MTRRRRRLGWVGWLNALGWILGLGLFFAPVPFLPLVAAVWLMPPGFLVLATLRPGLFTSLDDQASPGTRRIGARLTTLSGLWFFPCLSIALCAMQATELIDWFWPLLFGSGLAVPVTLACRRVDARMRGWATAQNALLSLCWCWGGLVLANALLDVTPGRIVVAEVTSRTSPRDDPALTLRLPDGVSLSDVEVAQALYDRTPTGGRVCVEINPGVFGWREAYLADCQAPLRDLEPAPGHRAARP